MKDIEDKVYTSHPQWYDTTEYTTPAHHILGGMIPQNTQHPHITSSEWYCAWHRSQFMIIYSNKRAPTSLTRVNFIEAISAPRRFLASLHTTVHTGWINSTTFGRLISTNSIRDGSNSLGAVQHLTNTDFPLT